MRIRKHQILPLLSEHPSARLNLSMPQDCAYTSQAVHTTVRPQRSRARRSGEERLADSIARELVAAGQGRLAEGVRRSVFRTASDVE